MTTHSLLLRGVLGIALAWPAVNLGHGQQAPPTAAPAKAAADEFAARGQREARNIKYGDWQKLCFKPGGAKMVCRTAISGTFETGQTAVRIYVTEREGDSNARLQLFLPVGLYMPPGVKLTVDKGTAHKIPVHVLPDQYLHCRRRRQVLELLRELDRRQEHGSGSRRHQHAGGHDIAAARPVRRGAQGCSGTGL